MAITKKQLAFDLYADKKSPIYKYFNNLSTAYYHIEKSLNENGFPCHRQGSVYVSEKPLSDDKVTIVLSKVCSQLPWLSDCVRQLDVTNIGKTHSLLDAIKEFCERYEDDKLQMEQDHSQSIDDSDWER